MIAADREKRNEPIRYVRILKLIPICPKHGKRMRRYSGRGPTRYYKCPDCNEKAPGSTREI